MDGLESGFGRIGDRIASVTGSLILIELHDQVTRSIGRTGLVSGTGSGSLQGPLRGPVARSGTGSGTK